MAGRKFSIMQYLNTRCAELDPLSSFRATNAAEARKWRSRALAKIRDLLGESPEWVPLQAETVESVDAGTYVRHKIIFDSDHYSSVPAYILIPKELSEPGPALLCLHGHGPGKDVVAGVTTADACHSEQDKQQSITQHNYDYARQFAERGYVTFTFDFRCFGERAETACPLNGHDPCNVHFLHGSLLGINLLALNIHDAIRALDYLTERPEVDCGRIGCVGLSLGGAMTMWVAAVDKRIAAAVISGYICEFERFAVREGNLCGSQFVPALRRYFDTCDIAALIAPRPLLVQSGIHDQDFPIESAQRAFEKLERAYKVLGKPRCLAHDIFEGGRRFHAETAFEWFDRWL